VVLETESGVKIHSYNWEKSIYLTRLILSKILGPKRDEIMGDWRKLHWWNDNSQRKTNVLEEKPALVPLGPPEILQ
jgi:hypothetical protein